MQIIMDREAIKNDVEVLSGQIEGLFNLLYDQRRGEVPSCYDAMLETMAGTVRDLRRKVLTAPNVQ